MRLIELLSPWIYLPAEFDREIIGLSIDSRRILPEQIFIALIGNELDGREFIDKALQFGGSVVITEGKDASVRWYAEPKVPYITLPNLRQLYGAIASRFYGEPSRSLQVIGVTGTNGKTSCTHFIASILSRLGKRCGIIGTLGYGPLGELQKTINTTPDAITIQSVLAKMRDQGFHSVAMEVASHALAQHRVTGIHFAASVFTNLTQDHLDYHGTMENYAEVKKKLFTEVKPRLCVLNGDDAYGQVWIDELSQQNTCVYPKQGDESRPCIAAYSVNRHCVNELAAPCIFVEKARYDQDGIYAKINSPWGEGEFTVPLLGQFNLSNVLAVITTLVSLGESLSDVLAQLPRISAVKGRMQLVAATGKPRVIIDYAHTPDALEKVLQTLQAYRPKELWCVFGCGGNRDKTKRPLMGEIASNYASRIILTDDNRRNETSKDIIADISVGLRAGVNYVIEPDRALAIQYAIAHASSEDMILIAGKGHEEYQEVEGTRHPFSDEEEVKRCFAS